MKGFKNIIAILVAVALSVALYASGSQESSAEGLVPVKLGITGAVYEELWAPAKASLVDKGIDLQFVQFSDYVTPNNALNSGEIDLNAFQHRIYFANEVEAYGYKISIIGNTFLTPQHLYSVKIDDVSQIKDGDIIAIPNDLTNGGRAFKVLEAAGLIELDPAAGFNPSLQDVTKYNTKIVIKELSANTIPSVLQDVTAACINGNYAIDFGLDPNLAFFKDPIRDVEYWNLIAARTEDLDDPEKVEIYRAIVDAYQQPWTEEIYNEQFGGFYIPVGWDEDLI